MADQKCFFFLKDITSLIEEATSAGGQDLGIIVYPSVAKDSKPKLKVSYIKSSAGASITVAVNAEGVTGAIDGCPYPPRCEWKKYLQWEH